MSDLAQQLSAQFPNWPFQFEYSLADRTYFKIGGPAEVYVELADKQQVAELVKFCQSNSVRLTMLGGASNVIVADEGVRGVVLHLTNDTVQDLGNGIRVGAGIKTALLVRNALDLGYTGLEYFLGVPGTLGGATYNNAHYLQNLIGEHITRVEIVDEQGNVRWLEKNECAFDYDYSRFHKTKEVIVTVEFELAKGDKDQSMQLIREATEYRARTQPLGLPSSGCIFQNTPNTPELQKLFPQFAERTHVPGGFLIDQAGLKGERIGEIEVSDKHAAFMINRGGGTTAQLKQLVSLVKQRVKEKFGVELREEVFYLG
jgi:UDP-N-acetylmuramate dehydrogenase